MSTCIKCKSFYNEYLIDGMCLTCVEKRIIELEDLANGATEAQLQAENAKLKEEIKQAYNEGLRAYAWWKDGVQYVGSCGTTLKQALKEITE